MGEDLPVSRWQVIGASVRGASHVRAELPNQDAIAWAPASGRGAAIVLTVSDGHGSAKAFRSDIGARLATQTALRTGLELLKLQRKTQNLSLLKHTAEERLPQGLVRGWYQAVEEDLEKHPLSEAELATLEQREGSTARQLLTTNPVIAYGATVLAVMIAEHAIIYLQLGDGDLLAVSDTGEVIRPLPPDSRLFANETTSLSSPKAWRDVRVGFQRLSGRPPALVALSTDGYANSFATDQAFLQVGGDLLAFLRSDGVKQTVANLPSWLTEASERGSGDDITVGLVCRIDALKSPLPSASVAVAPPPFNSTQPPPPSET